MTAPSTMAVALGLCAIGRKVLLAHNALGPDALRQSVLDEIENYLCAGVRFNAAKLRVSSEAGGVVVFVTDAESSIERAHGYEFHHFLGESWLTDENVARLKPLVRLEAGR